MKGLRKYLTPFAPDQSGAVSVLYELGGLIVICDAGGCAGNVCGFDEPRWFLHKSAVFSAGLRDMDAIMGRDDLLVKKLGDCAAKVEASFAAIIGTPVPAVIGTDYKALMRMAEKKTGLPVLSIDTSGTNWFDKGEEKAWKQLVEKFVKAESVGDTAAANANDAVMENAGKPVAESSDAADAANAGKPGVESSDAADAANAGKPGAESSDAADAANAGKPGVESSDAADAANAGKPGVEAAGVKDQIPETLKKRVGVWGMTPLEMSSITAGKDMEALLLEEGFDEADCYCMGAGLDRIATAGEADLNLVVSPAACTVAQKLQKMFGTPFEVRNPLAARKAADLTNDYDFAGKRVLIVNQQVSAVTMRRVLLEAGAAQVTCGTWFSEINALHEEGDVVLKDEEDFPAFVNAHEFDFILTDADLFPMIPDFEGVTVDLPQFSVSGRMADSDSGYQPAGPART